MEEIVKLAIKDLEEKYSPHTIILYGSYARNEATATSDIDIACFCDDAKEAKDARLFQGVYLDAWIYPTPALEKIPDSALRFGDGIAVVDHRGLGQPYIENVKQKLLAGKEPLSEADAAHLSAWIDKMLSRASTNDLDGNYRRTWLQYELLTIYFDVRGLWFLGHKKSFDYLQAHDSVAYNLFKLTYEAPHDIATLRKLANHVTSA